MGSEACSQVNEHVNIGEEGLTCTPSRKRQLSDNDHDVYDLDGDSSAGLMHIAKKQRGSVYNHENDDNGVVSLHVDNMTIYNMFESSKQVENLYTNFNQVTPGYCFTPYQRLWLYNGAPLVAFYNTLGIRRTYSRLKPPASSRGY